MPLDTTSQTALVAIAVAAGLQAVLFLSMAIAGLIAWRRLQAVLEQRFAALTGHMDTVVGEAQRAAHSIERLSGRASSAMDEARHAVHSVTGVVANRRTLLVAGVASAIGRWLASRRRRRLATAARSR